MIKRKRGDLPRPSGLAFILGTGVIILIVLSLIGAALVLTSRPTETPVSALPTPVPSLVLSLVPLSSPTPAPTSTPVGLLPASGTLYYSTGTQNIIRFDGDGPRRLPVKGDDIGVSPDGQKMAYVRDSSLFVYQDGQETQIQTNSPFVGPPVWNLDGTAMIFTTWQQPVTTTFRWDSATGQLSAMLSQKSTRPMPPPQPVPGVHRLLVADEAGAFGEWTALYTIDERCSTNDACQKSRQDITTVHHRLSWAAYHPSGLYIFFADQDASGIFALKTGSQEVTLLAGDPFPQRLAVGRDPGKLAYLGQNGNLFLFDIQSGVSTLLAPTGVVSISWAGG